MPPLRWTRSSTILLSGFLSVIFLIIYLWWPLAEEVLSYIDWHGPWWLYMDWLLIGLFLFMSLTIVLGADLRRDALIIFVATIGGLVIEAWGTQTNLWFYYTNERPPLWIVPAWPIATLSIDRLTRLLLFLTAPRPSNHPSPPALPSQHAAPDARFPISHFPPAPNTGRQTLKTEHWSLFTALYWLVFLAFLAIMLPFVWPTITKPYTLLSLLLCVLLIATPTDHRRTVLVFAAGAALGYFLELWGTTRECWTYYTFETPPLFAVLAHGMAAVAFWRTGLVLQKLARSVLLVFRPPVRSPGQD